MKKNQRTALSNRLDFTSLVLYSFLDGERSDLDSIAWKSCRGMSLSEIDVLFKEGPNEKLETTGQIVTSLGRKEIGTTDQNLIESVISPSVRQHLEIKLYWPKDPRDKGLKQSVKLRIRHTEAERERVQVELHRT